MKLGINQAAGPVAAALLSMCLAAGFAPPASAEEPVAVILTDAQYEALVASGTDSGSELGFKDPKIASVLLEVVESHRLRAGWRELAADRGLLLDGDSVLVEMRLNPDAARAAVWHVETLGGRVRHHNVPSLLEIWLPIDAVERSAEHSDVLMIRPARLVQPAAGSVTSEGLAALNVSTGAVTYDYHDLGADGAGITIANIDAGYSGYAALQASGDWPQPADLRRFEVDGGPVTDCDASACSNYEASAHGAATMEIVFDVAPGADYMTYRTTTVNDWYAALVHAADNGADIVTVSLSAPLDNVGDGSVCPPNFASPCGTIAEAAQYARSQGTLVVNSAGNYRTEHWGGPYADASGYLDWGTGGNVNVGGPGGGSIYCYPNGYNLSIDLFWDDWTAVTRDYDLVLFEYRRSSWRVRATSSLVQNGTPGQTPQEAIRYTVSGAWGSTHPYCSAGYGLFGIAVSDEGGGAGGNLQLFAGNWGALWYTDPDRSLGFPADSPDVFAAGAVDVASPGTLEDYSSEGPVLGPGGSQAAPSPANPKPDGVSVSGVSTVTYGPSGFGGTSSAAPHTAGVAAVLTQLRNEKYAAPPAANNPDGIHDLLSTFALEDPTFPATFATTYGNGLVKLRFCDRSVGVANNEWIMLGLPCVRRDASTVAEVLGDDLDLANVYWEVWDKDHVAGAYRQLFETDLMVPGRGYWLLYEGDATVDIQGLVQDRSEAFPMPLRGENTTYAFGNFLGHPFETDVDWPDATVVHGGTEYTLTDAITNGVLRNFMWKPYTTGGYIENDALLGEGTWSSFDGFWVRAFEDAELRIPTASAAEATETNGRMGRAMGWTVRLDATMSGITATARLGQLVDSAPGWDLHDAEHQGSFEDHRFAVVLPHPEWGEYAADYVRDYRAPKRSDSWSFEVTSNVGGSVVLRWAGPRRVLEQSVVVDVATGTTFSAIELEKEGYRFEMGAGARRFIWRVR
ncbi:MAG: S8 family serine peptidase [Candidatus Sulfomarinibacteraceae bacterium]